MVLNQSGPVSVQVRAGKTGGGHSLGAVRTCGAIGAGMVSDLGCVGTVARADGDMSHQESKTRPAAVRGRTTGNVGSPGTPYEVHRYDADQGPDS